MTATARQHALDQVLELVGLLNDDMTKALGRSGLTVPRAHLLWVLVQRGPVTQQQLADSMKVSPRNITGLVDGLVGTGFVTREPHPTDRRASLVSLTEQGASTSAALQDGQRALAEQLFGGVPPERLRGFSSGLDDVLARLRELTAEGS